MTEKAKTRFWKKVFKTEGCWLWTGARNSGYGQFGLNGKVLGAHRISWRMHNGPIPEGFCVLHKCDVPHCVNPDHLFIGTQADNMRDKVRKDRQAKGMKNGNVKLTREQVLEIRDKYVPRKYTLVELADEYGVFHKQIHRIVTGKQWTHI